MAPDGFMRRLKRWLVLSGIPPCPRLDFLNALFRFGKWFKLHPAPKHLPEREALYDYLFSAFIREAPLDYLEFGVFRGDSLFHWSRLSRNPASRFFGFDTFTGLPEPWQAGLRTWEKGHFDAQGQIPPTDDRRIQFLKGTFQETLPGFLAAFRPQPNLVVHCDADLFTSTLYVLARLDPVLAPGTILIFDNFSVANHDFRAFISWSTSFQRKYEVLASAEPDFDKMAFRLL